jgi:tetratricopeptide (TPR) repeat protein
MALIMRFFLLFFLTLAASAAASADSPRDLWPQATAATEQGDFETSERRLNELMELGRALGVRRFPLYAESAASLARQAGVDGNRQLEAWALLAASKLDPASPNVAFTAADLARSRSDWREMVGHLLAGVRNVSNDYTASMIARADLSVVILVALSAVTIIFGIILFFRYRSAALHDFRELTGRRFTPGVASVLAVALLIAPVFFWLGPFWLLLYFLALFFGYATIREKTVIVLLLLITAAVPVLLDQAAFRIAALDHPVIQAAAVGQDRSYSPTTLRRLRDVVELVPDNARLQLLLGNLELNEGNDSQALIHFRKATEFDPRLAGALINIGNLHFLNNDFAAAISHYERAAQAMPDLAIAYYNQSVASGEMYRFDLQGERLAQAKSRDRSVVEKILAAPPAQKVVRYTLPVDEAWSLSQEVALREQAREIFGSYASFDLAASAANPLTIGALLALLAAMVVFTFRRKSGFAGACIKCGRTFCHHCKSARESAIYCTQCIHIYLKRDGVSIDTKRQKLSDVQKHQNGLIRTRRILGTVFPGAGQIHEGQLISGITGLILFALFVSMAVLIGRLAPIAYPAETLKMAMRTLSISGAVVVWMIMAIPVLRQRGPAA